MAVTGIEVRGELLRVAVTFTAALPPVTESVAIGAVFAGEDQGDAGITPELIDPVNLKAYEVVTGGTEAGETVDLVDGVPRTLVFYYAASQDEVESLDIPWSSHLPPLTDVPLSQ